jgi:hypothetical protein
MEYTADQLADVKTELQEAKTVLQQLSNDVRALAGIVNPLLEEHVAALRRARMATVGEVHQTLTALKDIRKFFLDQQYTLEIDRLQQFVQLCQALADLKQSGVLDAICDSAIRLAIREETAHERQGPPSSSDPSRRGDAADR